jgi:hypothetical protein
MSAPYDYFAQADLSLEGNSSAFCTGSLPGMLDVRHSAARLIFPAQPLFHSLNCLLRCLMLLGAPSQSSEAMGYQVWDDASGAMTKDEQRNLTRFVDSILRT